MTRVAYYTAIDLTRLQPSHYAVINYAAAGSK